MGIGKMVFRLVTGKTVEQMNKERAANEALGRECWIVLATTFKAVLTLVSSVKPQSQVTR
jgi:hypothetical protein